MDDLQLGKTLGSLGEGQRGLERSVDELRAVGTKEHDEVKKLLTGIRDDLAKKADKEEVEAVKESSDNNKSRLDRLTGIGIAIVFAGPLAIGVLLHIVGAA